MATKAKASARRFDWDTIQYEYECGTSMNELMRRYGVNKSSISRRAKHEGWTQYLTDAVDRLAEAKANGLAHSRGVDFKTRSQALEEAADRKVAVINRHRQEWDEHAKWVQQAIEDGDLEAAKLAKITAETLKIRQEGERKAWGIADRIEPAKVEVLSKEQCDAAVKAFMLGKDGKEAE